MSDARADREAAGGRRHRTLIAAGAGVIVCAMLAAGTWAASSTDFIEAPTSPEPVGQDPLSVATADLDGDSDTDLAVSNSADDNLSILLNTGSGDFTPAASSPVQVGDRPTIVVVADFDGDLDQDLAVPNQNDDNVSFLRNDGSANFVEPASSPEAVGDEPTELVATNVDGDADPDLAIANFGSEDVTILRNNGAGNFIQPASSPEPAGAGAIAIAAADLDGDLDRDLAVALHLAGSVTILRNDGAGDFVEPASSPELINSLARPTALVAADLDGDSDQDVAVANESEDSVNILRNNGSGNFVEPASSPEPAGPNPTSVVAADFDNDFDQDLAVANQAASGRLTVLRNGGTGNFAEPGSSPEATPPFPFPAVAADLDGDSDQDLAVASIVTDDVTVLRNVGSGNFTQPASSPEPAGDSPASVAKADLDGDTDQDLAVANTLSDDLTVLRNTGTGDLAEPGSSPEAAGDGPTSVAAADLDGDSDQDLAVANNGSDNVTILRNTGSGAFAQPASSPEAAGDSPTSVAAADLDGDGDRDLAVTNSVDDNVTILRNTGGGNFVQPASSPEAGDDGPVSIVAADLDGDLDADLAVSNFFGGVTVMRNNGSANFAQPASSPEPTGANPRELTAADLDGDGDNDLAVANQLGANVTILRNAGSGNFAEPATSPEPAGTGPFSIKAADLDDDGDNDLAVTNSSVDSVSILRNAGSGNFAEPATSPEAAGDGPTGIVAGDLDGDLDRDLAVANQLSDNVTILLAP
jgi:hypothetical protein